MKTFIGNAVELKTDPCDKLNTCWHINGHL